MSQIHPMAIVDAKARLGERVTVGPYCTVGADVTLADDVELVSHVVIAGHTEIGAGTRIFPFAAVGLPPQDRKYHGEPSRLVVGKGSIIREHATWALASRLPRYDTIGRLVATVAENVFLEESVGAAAFRAITSKLNTPSSTGVPNSSIPRTVRPGMPPESRATSVTLSQWRTMFSVSPSARVPRSSCGWSQAGRSYAASASPGRS